MKYNQLKIIILSIWWGAFTSFAGITTFTGSQIATLPVEMGYVSEQITIYLNNFSLIIFLIYYYCVHNDEVNENNLLEQITAISIVGFQLLILLLYFYLTDLLDFEKYSIINQDSFYIIRRIYFIIEILIWIVISILITNGIIKLKN